MCDFALFSVKNLPFSCVCVFPYLVAFTFVKSDICFLQSVCCLFLQGPTGAPITDKSADDVIRQCCCCDSQLLMEIKKKVLVFCRTVGGIWRASRDEEGVWGYRDHTQVSTIQLAVCHCKVTL